MPASDDLPDTIPSPCGRYFVPNYAKPGVAERVAREAFAAECAAKPVKSSIGLLIRAQQIARFERNAEGE